MPTGKAAFITREPQSGGSRLVCRLQVLMLAAPTNVPTFGVQWP